MSRTKIKLKKGKPQISAEALVKAIVDLKEMNDKIIQAVEVKLKEFHAKLNDLNERVCSISKEEGEKNGSDVSGVNTGTGTPGESMPPL